MRSGRKNNLVMIADDDYFIRKTVRICLAELTDFLDIENGAEVEKAYVDHNPDIVFLDVHLPNRSGLDIIARLLERDPEAYIIMLSGDSSAKNVQEAMKKGAKGFLAKPFSRERLLHYFNACPHIKFADT